MGQQSSPGKQRHDGSDDVLGLGSAYAVVRKSEDSIRSCFILGMVKSAIRLRYIFGRLTLSDVSQLEIIELPESFTCKLLHIYRMPPIPYRATSPQIYSNEIERSATEPICL